MKHTPAPSSGHQARPSAFGRTTLPGLSESGWPEGTSGHFVAARFSRPRRHRPRAYTRSGQISMSHTARRASFASALYWEMSEKEKPPYGERENANAEARMNAAMQAEFDRFWRVYPKREAKKAALKAYVKARKEATAEQIEEAVRQYIAHKPKWQNYALPASWLNAGRYLDEYDTTPAPTQSVDDFLAALGHWTAGCKRLHGGTCENANTHYARVEAEQSKASA